MVYDLSILVESFKGLSIIEGAPLLKMLVLYIVGITIYSIFIFKFYKFIADKDIFKLNLQQYGNSNASSFFFYILEYLVIFPLIVAFWFSILFVMLIFLSKNQIVTHVLITSMAIIAIIRVTAYYNDELSKDLAKMLPFTLLGFFLIDSSYFSFSNSIEMLKQSPSYLTEFIYYFLFVIIIEFLLRIFYSLYTYFIKNY